jgi:DNA helicase-2/ATP-dependent DNA helicase PcrA
MSAPMDCLAGLNPEQRAAVEAIEGPLLILAGAGSGKTRVLTHRIAHMLAHGIPPWQILAVTFTNKAAEEMKGRVRDMIGDGADKVLVSTFHSACVRFLRQDIEVLGIKRNFTIYDTDDQRRLVKQISKDMNIDPKTWKPRKIMGIIDKAKVKMLDADGLAAERGVHGNDPMPRMYRKYEEHLRLANAVDFNDLLNLTVRMWQEHPAVLARYQGRFRYVMVDEYQDTNLAQYLLIKLLAQAHKNLAVVGDDDQSIYGFRGADIRNILDFERDFPGTKVVCLERNYRSTSNILAAAHGVVQNNRSRMEKKLWTDVDGGAKIRLLVGQDEMDEANKVLAEMRLARSRGRSWGDFAVIYRTNASSRAFEQVLVQSRVPHILVGARRFYERREVRDMLGYLKLVLNPTDDMALLRVLNVPSRGIGAVAIRGIRALAEAEGLPLLAATARWAEVGTGRGRRSAKKFCALLDRARGLARDIPPGDLVTFLAEESGYIENLRSEDSSEAQGRLDNIQELARAVAEDPAAAFGAEDAHPLDRLQSFIDRACLTGQDSDLPDNSDTEGPVTLLTAHLCKGLEFPVVFCTGMSEGGFPHHLARDKEEDLEEERRLVYVAFTRAEKELFVTRPRRRLVMGTGFQAAEPSRFLDEIPDELLVGDKEKKPSWMRKRPAAKSANLPVQGDTPAVPDGVFRTETPQSVDDLGPGTRVLHPTFGMGVIRRCEGAAGNLKLHIVFDRHGAKAVYARYARLEVLLG